MLREKMGTRIEREHLFELVQPVSIVLIEVDVVKFALLPMLAGYLVVVPV